MQSLIADVFRVRWRACCKHCKGQGLVPIECAYGDTVTLCDACFGLGKWTNDPFNRTPHHLRAVVMRRGAYGAAA